MNRVIPQKELDEICSALWAARNYFEKRDEMNAQLHLAAVRPTEITTKIKRAHVLALSLLPEQNQDANDGTYTEKAGNGDE